MLLYFAFLDLVGVYLTLSQAASTKLLGFRPSLISVLQFMFVLIGMHMHMLAKFVVIIRYIYANRAFLICIGIQGMHCHNQSGGAPEFSVLVGTSGGVFRWVRE